MLTKFHSLAARQSVSFPLSATATDPATAGGTESLTALEAALKRALSNPILNPDHPWASALSADAAEVAALVLPALAGAGAAALATAYVGAYFYYQVQGQSNPGAYALKWLCDQLQSLWNLSAPQARAVASMLQQNIPAAVSNATNPLQLGRELKQLRGELVAVFEQLVQQFRPGTQGQTTAPARSRVQPTGGRLGQPGSGFPSNSPTPNSGGPNRPEIQSLLRWIRQASQLSAQLVGKQREYPALWARAQQQLAQFYWDAAGGQAGLGDARQSLSQIRQTLSDLQALERQSQPIVVELRRQAHELGQQPSGHAGAELALKIASQLEQVQAWAGGGQAWQEQLTAQNRALRTWLPNAQKYLDRAGGSLQTARLPAPPEFSGEAVKKAAKAASAALRPDPTKTERVKPPELGRPTEKRRPDLLQPGERLTVNSSKPGTATGLEAQKLEQAYWDKVRAAADAVLEQLRRFPLMRANINKLIEAAAQQFQISNLEDVARAVKALGNQLQAGATGGVRASTGSVRNNSNTAAGVPRGVPVEQLPEFISLSEYQPTPHSITTILSMAVRTGTANKPNLTGLFVSKFWDRAQPASLHSGSLLDVIKTALGQTFGSSPPGTQILILHTKRDKSELPIRSANKQDLPSPYENVHLVETDGVLTLDELHRILDIVIKKSIGAIITVGGSGPLDIMRAVQTLLETPTADELAKKINVVSTNDPTRLALLKLHGELPRQKIRTIAVPTNLSTTGTHTAVSVVKPIKEGGGLPLMKHKSPNLTLIPVDVIARAPERLLYAGIMDYLAGWSASLMSALDKNKSWQDNLITFAPEVAVVLKWFQDEGMKMASNHPDVLNVATWASFQFALQDSKTGWEHLLFYSACSVGIGKHLTHGEWAGLGAVFHAFMYGKLSGDMTAYEDMRSLFGQMGLPLNLSTLNERGLSIDDLLTAIEHSVIGEQRLPSLARRYLTNIEGAFDQSKARQMLTTILRSN